MLGVHKVTLALFLSMGPVKIACHATVSPHERCEASDASEGTEEGAEACALPATHSRATRSPSIRQVVQPHACANASSCDTTTSAPG